MKARLLLFGVDDFAGGLISRRAAQRGFAHIASGTDIARVASLSNELSRKTPNLVEPRIFRLGDKEKLCAQLDDVAVLVNACPRFDEVAPALIEACLETRTNYIDLCKDSIDLVKVFARNSDAQAAGITLVPGAGFDACAVDSMAARLATMLPNATHLTIAVSRSPLSQSEARSLVGACRVPGQLLRDGVLTAENPGARSLKIDFGQGETEAWLAPWRGESVIAGRRGPFKTVESYEVLHPAIVRNVIKPGLRRWMFRRGYRIAALERKIGTRREGPTNRQLARNACVIWGEARNAEGQTARARLQTPAAHIYTADAIIPLVRSLMDAKHPSGICLPSEIGGAALVESIDGVQWRELPDAKEAEAHELPSPALVQA